jgi:hypothetical protein
MESVCFDDRSFTEKNVTYSNKYHQGFRESNESILAKVDSTR